MKGMRSWVGLSLDGWPLWYIYNSRREETHPAQKGENQIDAGQSRGWRRADESVDGVARENHQPKGGRS